MGKKEVVKTGRPIPGFSLNKAGVKVSDGKIKSLISDYIAGDGYAAGYRKITAYLVDDKNLIINHKKVYRLCKELGILRAQRKIFTKAPRKLAKKAIVTASNQLWEIDIKYGRIHSSGRFFFQASIIDVFDRNIIAYHLGLTCKTKQIILALEEALQKRNLVDKSEMLVIRTDNGPQFVSKAFAKALKKRNMVHERIPVATPNMNAHIEAFHSILEAECYAINEFISFEDAYTKIDQFMRLYNERRKHGSLKYKSPMQFYLMHQQNATKANANVA